MYIVDWTYGAGPDRTNVTLVEHRKGMEPTTTSITDVKGLDASLRVTAPSADAQVIPNADKALRLFLVEELSHEIIESLGSRFSIDPFFFRVQLGHNLFPKDPPALHSTQKSRQWFTIRNVRLRYHASNQSLRDAITETRKFNMLRDLETEWSSKECDDDPNTHSSILSTQTTIWIGKDKRCHNSPVSIMLLDPSISEGTSQWRDRTNWLPMPDMDSDIGPQKSETSNSWYKDIVRMTATYPWFESPVSTKEVDAGMMVNPAFYTICAEWFLVCNYIHARVSLIEEFITFRGYFVVRGSQIDQALESVSTWKARLSKWRKMVEETLEEAVPTAARLTFEITPSPPDDTFEDIVVDFKRVLRTLTQLQSRVDRLQELGTAKMQLTAARQSLAESHDLARLTWLATIFIPLTFMSGLFSMTEDIGSMRGTFKTYFAAAVPVAVVSLVVARWGSAVVRWVGYVVGMMRNKIGVWATQGSTKLASLRK
jgi:hypothetical protein